jgi:iron complex outermembrane receptor protein
MGNFDRADFKSKLRASTMIAFLALTASAAQAAHAEDATTTESAPAAAETASATGELVVSAQRRKQSTMDVGINVTQLSTERLSEQRVTRLGELIGLTSNVEVREIRPGGGQPAVTIRGVGMNDFTVASNPSTAVYFDGVYSPNIGTISQQFFDVASVEVLKGPQSALYGRNATAGAMTITSAQPTDDFSGYAKVGVGNYKALDAEGAISGPLANGLTGRLSLRTRQMYEGWMHNTYPGASDIGELHQAAMRAQMKYESGDFTIHGIFSYHHEDDQPGAFTAFGRHVSGSAQGAVTANCAVSASGQIDFNNTCVSSFGNQRTSTDVRTISENDSWAVKSNAYTGTVIATWALDGFNITSTTGYMNWYESYSKGDGLAMTEQLAVWYQRTRQVSEDLQFSSTGNRKLTWLGGLYLSSANTNIYVPSYVPLSSASYVGLHDGNTRTIQGYGQIDYKFAPKFTLSVGARYLHEYNAKVGGTWKDLNANGVADASDTQQAYVNSSFTQNALTGKIGLNYRPSSTSLLYASYTRGYKSGGYIFAAIATANDQLTPYGGEHINAYEIGLKQKMLDGAVNFNTSLFYYDYKGMQTNLQWASGALNINKFANLNDASVKGIDAELVLRPISGLELRLDGGWIETRVGTFTSGGVTYAAGNRFANAPSFTGSASFRYEHPLTNTIDVALSASAHRQSSIYSNTENTPLYRINSAVTLVDAQLQFKLRPNDVTVALWGKNLTDAAYTNSTFQNGSTVNTLYNMPRTYGLSATKRF